MTTVDHIRMAAARAKKARKLARYTETVQAMMVLEMTRQEIADWPELTFPIDPQDSPEWGEDFCEIEVDGVVAA